MSSKLKPATPKSASSPRSGRGERLATVGTLVSGILATSCCWGPLLLLGLGLLGVSTGGLTRTLRVGLAAYRPVFIGVTFAFLGLALYLTYRPRRRPAAAAEDC